MTEKLPAHTLLKLEQTLAQWPRWRGSDSIPGSPHVVAVLQGGISNYNVLAEAAGMQFAIRIDGVNPAANGLNRQAEWRALQAAHAAGIAPRPRYFNPELGSLVCDYLPPDDERPFETADLAALLRKIHSLPALHSRLDLGDRIRRYQRQLAPLDTAFPKALASLDDRMQAILAGLDAGGCAPALCHNDLNPANLIFSGEQLYALDWEYCAMGDPWFDLAALVEGHELDEAAAETLLEHYLQRPVDHSDCLRLKRQRCVSSYIELHWYASQKPSHHDLSVLEEKLRLLQARVVQVLPGDKR